MDELQRAQAEGRAKESRLQKTGVAKKESAEASLARAEARIREIRGNMPAGGQNRDKFWAPPPPEGFDYQFKMKTVMGEEFYSYQVELARNGWEAVPLSRHPEMMPAGWTGETIEIEIGRAHV